MRIATYNCQGINEILKREAIKEWAATRRLDLVALTETKHKGQAKEGNSNTEYTTFLASDPDEWTTTQYHTKAEQGGVGVMIKSSLMPSVLSVDQHGSRILSIRLKTQPPCKIIIAYMPQATGYSWEQKSYHYDQLNDILDKTPKKEPVYIMGDFNTRLQET